MQYCCFSGNISLHFVQGNKNNPKMLPGFFTIYMSIYEGEKKMEFNQFTKHKLKYE